MANVECFELKKTVENTRVLGCEFKVGQIIIRQDKRFQYVQAIEAQRLNKRDRVALQSQERYFLEHTQQIHSYVFKFVVVQAQIVELIFLVEQVDELRLGNLIE
jgi:hypothetical protein